MMQRIRTSITVPEHLFEYAKAYAKQQDTTISQIFNQLLLNLMRTKEGNPTETILSDPDFKKSLFETISKIRTGKVKWSSYKKVFK